METELSTFVDDGAAAGETFLPDAGMSGRGGPPPTKVPACPAFYYAFDPNRWTVMGRQVVPAFVKVPFSDGVNGARAIRDREGRIVRFDMGDARAQHEERGRKIIPHEAVPAAHLKPGQRPSYIYRPKGRPDVHLSLYEKCYPGSEQVDCDEKRFLEWCTWLEAKGFITPVPLHVLRNLLDVKKAELGKTSDKALTNPSLRPLVERLAGDVEAIEEALHARVERLGSAPSDGDTFDPAEA